MKRLALFLFSTAALEAQIPLQSPLNDVIVRDETLILATDTRGLLGLSLESGGPALPLNIAGLPLQIFSVAQSADSSLWVATNTGLFRVHHDAIAESWNQRSGLASDRVTVIRVSVDGALWIGTDKGLARMSGSTYQFFAETYGKEISDIAIRSGSEVLAIADGTLWWWKDGIFRDIKLQDVQSVITNPNGLVVAGTRQGVYHLSGPDAIQAIPQAPAMPSMVASDPAGYVWCLSTVSGAETHLLRLEYHQEKWQVSRKQTTGLSESRGLRVLPSGTRILLGHSELRSLLPDSSDVLSAELLYNSAREYYLLGDIHRARRNLQWLIGSFPWRADKFDGHLLAGQVHLTAGNSETAARHFRKALEITPGSEEGELGLAMSVHPSDQSLQLFAKLATSSRKPTTVLAAWPFLKGSSRLDELRGKPGLVQALAGSETVNVLRSADSTRAFEIALDLFQHSTNLESLRRIAFFYDGYVRHQVHDRFPASVEPRVMTWEGTARRSVVRDNQLWVGTADSGLMKIDVENRTIETIRGASSLPSDHINDIAIDSEGKVWICTGRRDVKEKAGLVSEANGVWTVYESRHGLGNVIPLSVAVTADAIYCLTDRGLFVSSSKTNPQFRLRDALKGQSFSTCRADNLGRIWLAGDTSLSVYADNKLSRVETDKDRRPRVLQFRIEVTGEKGISTDSGYYRFDDGAFVRIGTERTFSRGLGPEGDEWRTDGRFIHRRGELGDIQYEVESAVDSLFDFQRCGKYRVFIGRNGAWISHETAGDTVRLLDALDREVQTALIGDQPGRIRAKIRKWARLPQTADYVVWTTAKILMREDKATEAFGLLHDHKRVGGSFLDEVPVYLAAMNLDETGEHEKATTAVSLLARNFSTQTGVDPKQPLDLSLEGNERIKRLPASLIRVAAEWMRRGNSDAAVRWVRAVQMDYQNIPEEAMFALQQLIDQSDTTAVVKSKLARIYVRAIGYKTALNLCANLHFLADWSEQQGQMKEAGEYIRGLLETGQFQALRPQLEARMAKLQQSAALGLKAGSGVTELNSTNAMIFEGNYLWLGTSKGVLRWNLSNGSYKKFDSKDGLVVDNVFSILTDRTGGKWFGGFDPTSPGKVGGVSYFDGETFANFSPANGLQGATVRALAQDPDGGIWIGTEAGVTRFYGGQLEFHDLRKKYRFDYINDLYFDRGGRLWIALAPEKGYESMTGGVVRFDDLHLREKDGLKANHVKSVTQDSAGNYWFSTYAGIAMWDGDKKWSHIQVSDGLTSDLVRDVELTAEEVWVATNAGITRIAKNESTRSAGGGLQRSDVTRYTEKEGLLTNDIRTVVSDPKHGTWFGSKRGIFSLGNKETTAEEESTFSRKLFEVSAESEALFERARQFLEQGDYDKAREIYLDVLDRAGDGEWADDAELLLAKSYEVEGNYQEAEKRYESFITQNPASPLLAEAQIGLGSVLEKTQRFEDAEKAYAAAAKSAADEATVNQARLLQEKAAVKRIESGRKQTQSLAQLISEKNIELERATSESERERIRAEIRDLEAKAARSARAGGFDLKLYKVQTGDNLWALSEKFLGDPLKWKDFFIANEGKIYDPNVILVGQTIVVLTVQQGYKEKLEEFLYYDVVAGEDLETIAEKLYGNKEKWQGIYKLNKEKLSESPKKSLPAMRIMVPVNE